MTRGGFSWARSIAARYVPLDAVDAAESRTTEPSALYACDVCDTTYISTEMESCPNCDTAVEEIPSETDLGFTSTDV